jgi:hypothetical protein
MSEHDEFYADSGLPIEERKLTRRGALKLGAVGVAGAAFAAFLPGRAKSAVGHNQCTLANSVPNAVTQCNSNAAYGVDGLGCFCFDIYYPRLKPVGAPTSFCGVDQFCFELSPCPNGSQDCPRNQVCIPPNNGCGLAVCITPCPNDITLAPVAPDTARAGKGRTTATGRSA